MNKEISIKKVKHDAEEAYRVGDFFCSEAIVNSVRDNIDPDMPEALIAAASGFPVGIGKSKCVCGAVSGGVMALSYFFGRTKGGDTKVVKNLELANELQEEFRKNHKVLCCKILTHGMDMGAKEHKDQCVAFTGEVAEVAATIIARELGLKVVE
ncbi:MAG: C-GCAxxG-C-C family (seleno)protein [Cetobacterium sp.]|uniref:C-GCAxxG-C-C family (seleno)protein n=1 Tax=unclassified Cetobacterium TaxID=2630983 RepID=UPI0006466FD0|nr:MULTISPECIES: C-GCAxxG-C-C family (seleno)protein [unclassified Cetobacterium]